MPIGLGLTENNVQFLSQCTTHTFAGLVPIAHGLAVTWSRYDLAQS
jgi:hypothetical protein